VCYVDGLHRLPPGKEGIPPDGALHTRVSMSSSDGKRTLVAIAEQQIPFAALDLAAQPPERFLLRCQLAQIDEYTWVPRLPLSEGRAKFRPG
jgi:hypothetical protein